MERIFAFALLLLALLLPACKDDPAPATPPPATPPSTSNATPRASTLPSAYRVNAALPHGSLLITVRAGSPVEPRPIAIPADYRSRNPKEAEQCAACPSGDPLLDESLLVDPKSLGIRNVAVSLRRIEEGLLPALDRTIIDNKCCRFVPHLAFAPVGQPLVIKNSDPMSHGTMIWNRSEVQLYSVIVPTGEQTETSTIDATGIVYLTCPMHSWMRASIIGTRHPYVAITDATGSARLAKVPTGTHDLVFWHETLGTATRQVVVEAAKESTLALTDADFAKKN